MGAEIIILFIVAVMSVIGLLLMLGRMGIKRFLGYPNAMDIGATILFTLLFAGTFSGMVVAAFASLLLSVILWIMRSSVGAERLVLKRIGRIKWKLHWMHIPASECRPHWIARMFTKVAA